MSEIDGILSKLEVLIGSDTRNPPRAIAADDPVFAFIGAQLPGFSIQVTDLDDGCIALLAVRGEPRILFNFHLDTVPDTDGWSRDPFALTIIEDRAVGLGACDIKGALACMLDAAGRTDGDLAILVTTDEEAGVGRAVKAFLASDHGFSAAIVAEPTRCRAVAAHRGIVTARVVFSGEPGHASEQRVLVDSANHRAVKWIARCLQVADNWSGLERDGLRGVPLNFGRVEGGIKPNMIAERCEIRLGLRTLPGQSGEDLLETLRAEAPPAQLLEWETTFSAPSLPANPGLAGSDLVVELGLEPGEAVGFWSEAALFSEAGLPAIVLGSGDIAQAHTADEWVALEQLQQLRACYERLISNGL